VNEQCFERKCFDNKKCKEFSSAMDQPMFLNMSETICHLGRLGTWNLIDDFSKVCTEQCLLFDQLTCARIEQNHLVAAPSACDFQKVYLRSIRCCNKCEVNLFRFQRFDIMFSLSSSTKVGFCPIMYYRFGSCCRTLQYNSRSCCMQTRWPTNPTIFLSVRLYTGSQMPITNANILRMK